MAVRPQLGHNGGVAERRLRPIYDWLDNGNNKKALQEAEKVLKKTPSLQVARALKALSLLRLGRSEECHSVLTALAEERPSDDSTLQAMTMTYKECQQLHKACSLYEAAVKEEPTNEELHSHLFMSYVRIRDYRGQQRAAMTLYKHFPKSPYYFWAVMSIVLQAKESEDPSKKNILLTLSQRMVDNFISENKMDAEQEARLYIMILELQLKWEDIINFLEGPIYNKIVVGTSSQITLPYLQKLGHWRKINVMCKELLLDNQDHWSYYVYYLDSVFELMKAPPEVTEGESIDDTAEKCHEFICQLVESTPAKRILRGPYLARLELWKRLAKNGGAAEIMGSAVALCIQYLRVFAKKPCAVADLRPYIDMLPQKEREESCREFLTCLGFDEDTQPENLEDIQRHVNCVGLWRLCAPVTDAASYLTVGRTLRRHYLCALREGRAPTTVTEFCAADGYAVMAAHHYFYAAVLQKSSSPILEALSLLELVHQKSPANFYVKLLLVKLYHILGAALPADTVYQRLEVKHVQLTSLGWLHASALPACLLHGRALQLLADTCSFQSHHSKDNLEHLTYSYKYGSFEKLVELMDWSSRLERCVWSALAARERALLSLLAGPPAPLHVPPKLPEDPTDNRDLNAIISWEPIDRREADLKSRTMKQEVAYLRLKDGLVSSLALCIELSEPVPLEDKMKFYEQLKECTESLGSAMGKCKELYQEREKISITTPFPCRIIAFVNSPVPYREMYTKTLQLVGELALNKSAETHELCRQVIGLVDQARSLVTRILDEKLETEDGLWHMRETLEDISNYLEYLGVATFILGVCHELTAPAKVKKSKKKAANQSPEEKVTTELLNQLNNSLQSNLSNMEEFFDKLPAFSSKYSLEEEFTKISLNDYACPVQSKIKNGFSDISSDVQNVLTKKIKYLASLVR